MYNADSTSNCAATPTPVSYPSVHSYFAIGIPAYTGILRLSAQAHD